MTDDREHLTQRLHQIEAHMYRLEEKLRAMREERRRAVSRRDSAVRKIEAIAEIEDELRNLRVHLERDQAECLARLQQAEEAPR